ncbi:trifunctional dihydropteroate synthetase [Puccinia graminis f. sp. tritici]|nr:trifunctional dihydropteroate synthetase [Puccinia graminis f. sp. tritici]
MYVTDQPEFLNATCKISTPLSPQELLKIIKRIEADQGRILENVPRNGPRPIDIDILLYNSEIIRQDNLTIPHIGILERQFVLDPLIDVARKTIHPETRTPIEALLADLKQKTSSSTQTTSTGGVRKTHLIRGLGCRTLDLSSRTHLMSIINCTPDSFSDGGASFAAEDAVRNSLEHVSVGADILDIGGMSTRPGATEVSVETEIGRTVPVIRELRERHHLDCHISIDTFRAATAEAAVGAGATIVNDVSGGEADEAMLATVARLDVPYVLMHMRGNPRTMSQLTSYQDGDVVAGVRRELAVKVQRALRAGIKRWNLIIDPGFGFAKDLAGNCQLLDALNSLQGVSSSEDQDCLQGFPILVGLSRKQFLAKLLTLPPPGSTTTATPPPPLPPPDQRLVPTIVASTIAIRNGAHLIRAHDTKIIKEVINTVDGIRSFNSS